MAHVLYAVHPDHGHVIPTLAVVRQLLANGHRVSYLTGEATEVLIAGTGAEVLRYESAYREHDATRAAGELDYLASVLLSESVSMTAAAMQYFGGEAGAAHLPDVVVYDTSVLFCGRALAAIFRRPAVQLVPMFASNEHYSYLREIGADGGPREAQPAWLTTFLGDLGAFLSSYQIEVEPARLWWDVPERTLVTIPRALQPAGDTFDDRFRFVGPCLGDRSYLGSWAPASPKLVALVSCGAVYNQHPEVFRMCIEAFSGTDWHVVMTTADGVDTHSLGALPDNVEVHRWISHLDVLRHASVVITQGGMGTVLESLATSTPLVVVATSAMDRLTGRRISELGLGVDISLSRLSPGAIAAAVEFATSEACLPGVAQMAQLIANSGGAPAAARFIEDAAAEVVSS